MIVLNDLVRCHAPIQDALTAAAARVVASGWYVLGKEVEQFENAFAGYCGAAHCIGTANGTDALELALRAAGVQPGDRVVTVANAGMYASTAITAVGATPLYADVDAGSMNLCPRALAACMHEKPRAVIVTHLYGRMAAMEELIAVARAGNAIVIEDCAQAHGARRDGRHAGTFGDLGCFSFYPTKNLGALGDGGAVIASDAALAHRVRQLRQYGWRRKYHGELTGGRNSRLDEIQAALLSVKLPWLDRQNEARRRIAASYAAGIDNPRISAPAREGTDDAVHLYVVRLNDAAHREPLAAHLAAAGVQTDIHYPIPDHRQPLHADRFTATRLPVTEALATGILTLPCHPALSDKEIAHVIAACNAFAA